MWPMQLKRKLKSLVTHERKFLIRSSSLHMLCCTVKLIFRQRTGTQNIPISEPIREKYVQIFSLQAKYLRNVSENNLGEAHEKRLLHPPPPPKKGRERRKEEDRKGEKAAVKGGEGERRKGWMKTGGEGKWVGAVLALSEMLTHSHAGLPGPFPFLPPAQRTTAHPVCLPSPP